MNYKIIKYNCGCKYVFITDLEKRILKDYKFCPKHRKLIKHFVLYCEDCSLRMTETGKLAWQRKKRCLKCAKSNQKKRTKANWNEKAKKYNAKRRKSTINTKAKYQNIALNTAKKRIALEKLYKSMNRILPVIETPILDRFLTKEA